MPIDYFPNAFQVIPAIVHGPSQIKAQTVTLDGVYRWVDDVLLPTPREALVWDLDSNVDFCCGLGLPIYATADLPADPGRLGRVVYDSTDLTVKAWNGSIWDTISGGGGGGAPVNAQYVVLALSGSLTQERVLTAGSGIGLADAGANSTITVSNTGVLSAIAGTGIGVSGATGNVTFTNTGVTSIIAGSGIGINQSTGAVTITNTQPIESDPSAMSGVVIISDEDTVGAAVFPVTLDSDVYYVTLGVRPDTGTPPAVVARYLNPTVDGFDIELTAPPGTGNAVAVDWHVNISTSGGGGNVSGMGEAGQIAFWDGTESITGSNDLTWNEAKVRLVLGQSNSITVDDGNRLFIIGYQNDITATFPDDVFIFGRDITKDDGDDVVAIGRDIEILSTNASVFIGSEIISDNADNSAIFSNMAGNEISITDSTYVLHLNAASSGTEILDSDILVVIGDENTVDTALESMVVGFDNDMIDAEGSFIFGEENLCEEAFCYLIGSDNGSSTFDNFLVGKANSASAPHRFGFGGFVNFNGGTGTRPAIALGYDIASGLDDNFLIGFSRGTGALSATTADVVEIGVRTGATATSPSFRVGEGFIAAAPFGTSAGNTTVLRFMELAANGANYVGFKAPDTIASDVTWTLPSSDTAGFWKSNGSGTVSFQANGLTQVVTVRNAAGDGTTALTFTNGILTGVA